MKKITTITELMHTDTLIISDPISIQYLTQKRFDVGERMLVLLLRKKHKPLLFINKMFTGVDNIETIHFEDHENSAEILSTYIPHSGVIGVDGLFNARFLIPLLSNTRTFVNGSSVIESMRAIKDPYEMEQLRIASQHNDRIMEALLPYFQEGVSEIELANRVKTLQSQDPLSGISFEPSVVFTENIADPHGIPTTRRLKNGDVILVDMGGIYNGYCSDMTRTFFFGTHPQLETIYDIVLEAIETATLAVKPGARLCDVDKAARDVIESYGYGPQFIHRTGHGIGIEVHETLDVSSTNETMIQPGMCFSIEPGIYLQGIGGVRIEDLILVTDDGVEVLNKFSKEFKNLCD